MKCFLTIALVSGALAFLQAVHLHFDPMAERHYGRLVYVRIGGRDFAVPSEYIRGPLPHGLTKQLYIWAMLPDYTPYNGEITGDAGHTKEGWDRHISLMMEDTSYTTDLAFRYHAHRESAFLIPQDISDRYGLHRTSVFRKRPKDPAKYLWFDLYHTAGNNKQVDRFISCGRDETPPRNPVCQHVFQDGELLYQVGYSKTNLPEWYEIQSRVHDLIDSLSCVPSPGLINHDSDQKGRPCPI